MPRFILLEHTGAPDDPTGRHYDLLLEAGDACRTWRLPEIPRPGGPPIAAVELPAHRLAWLDHEAGEVSGGRGFACRVEAGEYRILASDAADPMRATRLTAVVGGAAASRLIDIAVTATAWVVTASAIEIGRR